MLGAGTVVGAIDPHTQNLSAVGKQEIRIRVYYQTNTDCSAYGPIRMIVVKPPKFGHLDYRPVKIYPNFSKEIPQAICNKQKVDANAVYYSAREGYVGKDEFEFLIIYADNDIKKDTVSMQVY